MLGLCPFRAIIHYFHLSTGRCPVLMLQPLQGDYSLLPSFNRAMPFALLNVNEQIQKPRKGDSKNPRIITIRILLIIDQL